MHELLEFLRLISAELLDGGFLLLFLNVSILLGLGSTRESLPRKRAAQEVKDNMTDSFKIVSSRLLVTKMSINRSVPGSSSEVLTISEGDVLTVGGLEAFSKTKINDVNSVLGLIVASNKEVVRFDVTMNDALFVNNLDSLDHLYSNMKYGLEIKLAAALLEQVFERLTEQVHNHDVIHLAIFGLLITNEMEVWNCGLTS